MGDAGIGRSGALSVGTVLGLCLCLAAPVGVVAHLWSLAAQPIRSGVGVDHWMLFVQVASVSLVCGAVVTKYVAVRKRLHLLLWLALGAETVIAVGSVTVLVESAGPDPLRAVNTVTGTHPNPSRELQRTLRAGSAALVGSALAFKPTVDVLTAERDASESVSNADPLGTARGTLVSFGAGVALLLVGVGVPAVAVAGPDVATAVTLVPVSAAVGIHFGVPLGILSDRVYRDGRYRKGLLALLIWAGLVAAESPVVVSALALAAVLTALGWRRRGWPRAG